MSDLKILLKYLQKSGYPNPTPDTPTIAKLVDYSIDNFLTDMTNHIGMEGTEDFVNKTFSKLGLMGEGMKIDLGESVGENGSYIYLIIYGFDIVYDEHGNEQDEVWIHYSWGDSHIIHDGEVKTLEDIYDEVDLGTMGEYEEFIDEIEYDCQNDIFNKTGIIIHFDSQI